MRTCHADSWLMYAEWAKMEGVTRAIKSRLCMTSDLSGDVFLLSFAIEFGVGTRMFGARTYTMYELVRAKIWWVAGVESRPIPPIMQLLLATARFECDNVNLYIELQSNGLNNA